MADTRRGIVLSASGMTGPSTVPQMNPNSGLLTQTIPTTQPLSTINNITPPQTECTSGQAIQHMIATPMIQTTNMAQPTQSRNRVTLTPQASLPFLGAGTRCCYETERSGDLTGNRPGQTGHKSVHI
ncbi:hypothetical protein GDO81_001175 [Engystomops pustulosus]|uniref:Uncharacterized protein n=1 Tax=Engystomops pustulosus TaxID=76066 RepID=A0AAV7DB26_ENGPU|nr:hypothetical protein GDO81_001175 [Engystomops pustulosus]